MNNRILFLLGGLVAGGAVVFFLPRPAGESSATAKSAPVVASPTPSSTVAGDKPVASTSVAKQGVAATGAWAKLSEKYGVEKAKHAQKISADLGDVIDEGMELANAMAKNTGAASPAEAASKEALKNLVPQLGLDEAQQEKASALITSAINDRMGAVTQLASAMRSDPEPMMEMFLAGDALSREEMTQAEYDQITQPTRTMLANMGGFVMGRPGANGQLLGDEAFTAQINDILTADQQTKLTELTSQWTQQAQAGAAGRNGGGLPFQNGQIPIMDLAKLDQSVGSVKKLAGAARIMVDAMQGLKDANPNAGLPK